MNRLPIRGALAFGIPVIAGFAFFALYVHVAGQSHSLLYLAAGPLCGVVGGLAYGRRVALPVVLGICFATIAVMFSLQETARSPWFSDVVWTGLVSALLFWIAGACAMLALPADSRFNGAMKMAVPGLVAGLAFQFLNGPAHYLLDLGSRRWWGDMPWEHFILWLIAGAGSGWLFGRELEKNQPREESGRNWAIASMGCAAIAVVIGFAFILRSRLPLGLFNSLSPITAASDWFWGWGVLGVTVAVAAIGKRTDRRWTVAALGIALILVVTSFRINADPWRTRFNSAYAQRLLRDEAQSGDGNYVGNLIMAQASLDKNDLPAAKQYLLQAAATPSSHMAEQNGLDVSVARILFDRGERDTVAEYLNKGKHLWPQGGQIINRWQNAIRAGRRPNFNFRNPNQQQQQN